jgi:hypothetical protein
VRWRGPGPASTVCARGRNRWAGAVSPGPMCPLAYVPLFRVYTLCGDASVACQPNATAIAFKPRVPGLMADLKDGYLVASYRAVFGLRGPLTVCNGTKVKLGSARRGPRASRPLAQPRSAVARASDAKPRSGCRCAPRVGPGRWSRQSMSSRASSRRALGAWGEKITRAHARVI